MTISFSALLVLAAVSYCGGLLVIAAGVRRVFAKPFSPRDFTPTVSVVVPARDEASNILGCLRSILESSYPAQKVEVIVVDDHSSDGTGEIVTAFFDERRRQRTAPRLRLLRCGHGAHGKQHALDLAIRSASGEIILTTDADCTVSHGWIQSMIARFGDRTGFVAGPVAYGDSASLVSRAEAVDFLALVATGAGTIGLGTPTICNSANAAYRKDLYFRQQLESEVAYGAAGDETLMHFVHSETDYEVDFCQSRDALVLTSGSKSIDGFLSQRARWAASTRHLVSGAGLIVLAVVFLFFCSMVIGFLWGLASMQVAVAFGIAFTLKAAGDAAVVHPFARGLNLPRSVAAFCVAEVLHAPAVILSVLIGTAGDVVWKGRSVRRYAVVAPEHSVRSVRR